MTRRNFLKVVVVVGLMGIALKGNALAQTLNSKSISYIEETANGYNVIFSDGSIMNVNETGLYVLGRLKEGASINQIVNELFEITKKDPNIIREDVEVFVDNLKVLKII
ncbi:MAG: PqqD family protein [Candidatus Hydrothermia bacterium]|jgi:long-subunit fatty acid transport protein